MRIDRIKMVIQIVFGQTIVQLITKVQLIKTVMENTIQRMTHIQPPNTIEINKATNSVKTMQIQTKRIQSKRMPFRVNQIHCNEINNQMAI